MTNDERAREIAKKAWSLNGDCDDYHCGDVCGIDKYCCLVYDEIKAALDEKDAKYFKMESDAAKCAGKAIKLIQQLAAAQEEVKRLKAAICVYGREELGNMVFENDDECVYYFIGYLASSEHAFERKLVETADTEKPEQAEADT